MSSSLILSNPPSKATSIRATRPSRPTAMTPAFSRSAQRSPSARFRRRANCCEMGRREHRADDPTLSITARSAGTDIARGAIGASIIPNHPLYEQDHRRSERSAPSSPAVTIAILKRETMKDQATSSRPTPHRVRSACHRRHGYEQRRRRKEHQRRPRAKPADHLASSLKVVFTDGKEYGFKPLSADEIAKKITLNNFEGGLPLYKKIWDLIQANYDAYSWRQSPIVSKNSAGYYLWNVYDNKAAGYLRPLPPHRRIARNIGHHHRDHLQTPPVAGSHAFRTSSTVFLPDLSAYQPTS